MKKLILLSLFCTDLFAGQPKPARTPAPVETATPSATATATPTATATETPTVSPKP